MKIARFVNHVAYDGFRPESISPNRWRAMMRWHERMVNEWMNETTLDEFRPFEYWVKYGSM